MIPSSTSAYPQHVRQNGTKDIESGTPSKKSTNKPQESMGQSSFSSSPIFAPFFKLSQEDFDPFQAFLTRMVNLKRGRFDVGEIQLKPTWSRRNHH